MTSQQQHLTNGATELEAVSIDTIFLHDCIDNLSAAVAGMDECRDEDKFRYDTYSILCAKEFGRVLEQSGKLLRKRIAAFFPSNLQADRLTFKDLFRYAAKHGLIEVDVAERWLVYRDNCNDRVGDFAEHLTDATLKLLPTFVADARVLTNVIEGASDGRPITSGASA